MTATQSAATEAAATGAAATASAAVIELEATIVRDEHTGGWTYVLLPGSKEVLGTGKAVRVAGTVDSVALEATLLPFGGGTHMLPLKQAVMRALDKADGDTVTVRIAPREERAR